jgi:polysaccharide deacetylase family protein (PEP-CTERM system associated)
VGDEKPHIVKKLYDAGHEIACHGYGHQLVSRMRQGEFRDDLIRARTILEDITGESVIGYRAPSYSVNKGNIGWYYETLEELGFKYSSSIFPVRTFLYGIDGFPENMHYPVVNGRRRGVLEIPVPVVNVMGSRIGLYVRLFPSWFIIDFIKRRNRTGKPVFLYLHPREIDPEQPRLRLPMLTSLIHYWGIRGCDGKVENILRSLRHKFVRMRDILSEEMQ